jgi:hypothetical protein
MTLTVSVFVGAEFQGHQVFVVELSGSRKGLLLGAVDAEGERLIEADGRVIGTKATFGVTFQGWNEVAARGNGTIGERWPRG